MSCTSGAQAFLALGGSSGAFRRLSVKESTCQCRRHGFDPWVGKIPWRRKWQLTAVFLPGESHGQRSLGRGGHSPWGCKESDTTQQLNNSKAEVLGFCACVSLCAWLSMPLTPESNSLTCVRCIYVCLQTVHVGWVFLCAYF